MPEKKWVLDQVFGVGDIGMVYGPPGCGKTFVIIDLILNLCMGTQWALRFNVERPLNIAYCAGEGTGGLPARFEAACQYYEIGDLHNFTYYKTVPQLYEDAGDQTTIRHFIAHWQSRQQAKEVESLDVLVIDTLHTATVAAEENSSTDMGKVLQCCRLASESLGCAVILVHHTNKSGTAERGSSSLRGAMDFMLEIRKASEEGTNAILSCSKSKDGEQWPDQSFNLSIVENCTSVRVLWDSPLTKQTIVKSKTEDKKRVLAELIRYPLTKFTATSLAEIINKSRNYTTELLNDLLKEGKCKRGLLEPNKPSSSRNPWGYFF
jgi:RecA-family ATPase